jgi:hypothetical protein
MFSDGLGHQFISVHQSLRIERERMNEPSIVYIYPLVRLYYVKGLLKGAPLLFEPEVTWTHKWLFDILKRIPLEVCSL